MLAKKTLNKLHIAAVCFICVSFFFVSAAIAAPAASPLAVTVDGLINEAPWQSAKSGLL